MSIINQVTLFPECPVNLLRAELVRARADAEEVGWFRWQSSCFTEVDVYKRNYTRCLYLKLRTEKLIRIAHWLLKASRQAGENGERLVVSTVVVPPPREFRLRSVQNRERALAYIAEQARVRVHHLGLLVQSLETSDHLLHRLGAMRP